MAQLTRTLTYRTDDETGEMGWQVVEMTGFDPVSSDGSPRGIATQMRLLTHDLIEHDPGYHPGTIANELGALGATWANRVQYEGIVTQQGLSGDITYMLERLTLHVESSEEFATDVDNEIPLVDATSEIRDSLQEFIANIVNSYSCDLFVAGTVISETLIQRICAHMTNGGNSFDKKFENANYGGVYGYIQDRLTEIFSSSDSLFESLGYYISPDELWEDFTVNLEIDLDNLEVAVTSDRMTLQNIIEWQDQMNYEDEDEDEDEDE